MGLFHPMRDAAPDPALLRRMADAVAHRGPDGEGYHAEPHLGLGHRRLSFVDLAGGAQPMSTADGALTVCFNGEIYNHATLRTELEALGHRFETRSDTEVLLHGWRAWGTALLGRLTGMFAFALWDRGRGELLLARDRAGEKPLHWGVLPDGTLAFASEIGGVLAAPAGDALRGLDRTAAEDFLALGYIPDPATIHARIRRLPAAHFLLLRRGEPLDLAPRRYWQPPRAARPAAALPGDVPGELRCRLDAAVRSQLMSDVPLGAFLSGGVDSASVVALAARAVAEGGLPPLSTFTIGFEEGHDERPAAAAIAARFGTAHRAESGRSDYLAAARDLAGVFGEPFGDHSAVPTLAVCRLARRHVKGALSGDGGDEVFGGYRRYRFHALVEAARRLLPRGVRRTVVAGLAAAYPKLDRAPRFLRAKTTLTELSLDSAAGYYGTVRKIADARRRALWSPAMRTALDGHDPGARFAALMAECDEADPLLQAQYADLHTYLPGDILVKTDRTSMAVSLELRPPLLDHALMAWGLALPAARKLAGGFGKRALREAMAGDLPADLLWGAKRGFADDLAGAFRGPGAAPVRARLGGEAMLDSGLFDGAALARLADEHAAGSFDHAQAIWQLLAFEGWLRREGGGARHPAPAQAEAA